MNGFHSNEPLSRAAEVSHVSFTVATIPPSLQIAARPNKIHRFKLIDAVKPLIIPFIQAADEAVPHRAAGEAVSDKRGRHVLVTSRRPEDLVDELAFSLPEGEGRGEDGLLQTIRNVLDFSVNTWDQGFMDKLYSSTNAVGTLKIPLCPANRV